MKSPTLVTVIFSKLLLLSACIGAPPTETPIPTIETADAKSDKQSLVIMLPGRGDRAETFMVNEFQMQGEQWGFDTVAVDAHFGYYMKRKLLPRLHEDVILPARAAGYQEIWLLGVSMGGFGSLLYATEYPDQVDGVILLAPYLGDKKLAQEIEASGGLRAWSGDAEKYEDYEINVWRWLQGVANGQSSTPVILGYGEADASAKIHRVLANALPTANVYSIQGGHKWAVWTQLWDQIAMDLEISGE